MMTLLPQDLGHLVGHIVIQKEVHGVGPAIWLAIRWSISPRWSS